MKHINLSNLSHAALALVAQIIIGILTNNWWAGAAFGASFYIGREVTQAEYRWIKRFGDGKRANMPAFGGFDLRVWKGEYDAILDWVVPTVAVVALAFFMTW